MIDLENATKTYRCGDEIINAVNGVNLRISDGEYVAIVGHSGSGKTTLVSLMGGLTRPTSGTVRVGGTDIWSLDNREVARLRGEEIGFCFQFPSLVATLTCVDNVRLPASFAAGRRGSRERAMELLELVALPGKAGAYPSELSGGQQRRVAIARALINEPRIILADEPTGDLDEDTEGDIMELLDKLNGEGVTIAMVTHSRNLASRAGRVLTMDSGSLSGSPAAT